MRPLEGKSALITGASRGFGLELAWAFLDAGASLMLCARDRDRLGETCLAVVDERDRSTGQRVFLEACDITDPHDVAGLAERTLKEFPGLDIVVSNAGTLGPIGKLEDVDWDEWVEAIETNLVGPAYLLRCLLPHFRAKGEGKFIQVAGGGATSPMPFLTSYAASKAAVVRFVESMAHECPFLEINAVAPGMLDTAMLDRMIEAGPDKVGPGLYQKAVACKRDGGTPVAMGTDLAVWLASDDSDGITGRLISAEWDDWLDWPDRLGEIRSSDLYTLRRVTE